MRLRRPGGTTGTCSNQPQPPVAAPAREVARRGEAWSLHYGGRTRSGMAFATELPAGDAVHLTPQDTHGLLPLDEIIGGTTPETVVYSCGPTPMLDAVTESCTRHGRTLHLERFTAAPPARTDPPSTGVAFEVRLARTGAVLTVPPDRSLLDVVLEVVPDAAFSCQEGYCGSCETHVLAGIPEHHDTVLSADERQRGETMMICVGRSASPRLVLDL